MMASGPFNDDELYDVDEAAAGLKVVPATVRKWLRDRELEGYRLGGAGYRITGRALNEFLQARFQPARRDAAGEDNDGGEN